MSSKAIFFDKDLLRSKAFRSLTKWGMLVYLDFLRKRKMTEIKNSGRKSWVIANNGEIVYPYAEAERRGINRSQFRNAIDELMEKGFVDIAEHGKGGKKGREGHLSMTRYIIDDRWIQFGTPDFRPPKNPRRKDTRKGRGWAVHWADDEKRAMMLSKRAKRKSTVSK